MQNGLKWAITPWSERHNRERAEGRLCCVGMCIYMHGARIGQLRRALYWDRCGSWSKKKTAQWPILRVATAAASQLGRALGELEQRKQLSALFCGWPRHRLGIRPEFNGAPLKNMPGVNRVQREHLNSGCGEKKGRERRKGKGRLA